MSKVWPWPFLTMHQKPVVNCVQLNSCYKVTFKYSLYYKEPLCDRPVICDQLFRGMFQWYLARMWLLEGFSGARWGWKINMVSWKLNKKQVGKVRVKTCPLISVYKILFNCIYCRINLIQMAKMDHMLLSVYILEKGIVSVTDHCNFACEPHAWASDCRQVGSW